MTILQGGNTRQLLQKEIEEEHRAAAVELMLRRRAMIKELYAREALQYRCSRWRRIGQPSLILFAGLNWRRKALFWLLMYVSPFPISIAQLLLLARKFAAGAAPGGGVARPSAPASVKVCISTS
jgi:hypothetical protein